MKLDPRQWIAPLVAIAILALILTETREALTQSGAWRRPPIAGRVTVDPFAPLDGVLATTPPGPAAALRDPFGSGVVAAEVTRPAHTTPRIVKPVAPERPRLTSIVFDSDPRATVRWDGRDYSVRAGSLFADFRVVSISRDRLVLDKGGEPVVLLLPQKGE